MGLETGTYISDLNPNWPVDATDQVGEGDDHLRLLKKTILNTWPSLTGAVNLTQDQINDAALKSVENTFTSRQQFGLGTQVPNNVPYAVSRASDGLRIPAVYMSTSDNVVFGDNAQDAQINSNAQIELRVSGLGSARVLSRANGSLSIYDNGVNAWGNVAAVHKAQSFSQLQDFPGGARVPNNQFFKAQLIDSSTINVIGFSASNNFLIGNAGYPSILYGDTISFNHSGTLAAFTDTQANGSLLVYDRFGVSRKVGFRGPAWRSKTSDHALVQDDEGTILNSSVAGITYTLDQLEAFTTVRIVNRSSGNITIAEGAGVTLSTRLGGSVLTGNRTVASHSVVEISYRSSTQVDMFGNGIS